LVGASAMAIPIGHWCNLSAMENGTQIHRIWKIKFFVWWIEILYFCQQQKTPFQVFNVHELVYNIIMKTKYNSRIGKLLILLIAIVFFGVNYKGVEASILYSQTSSNQLSNGSYDGGGGSPLLLQTLGTGLDGNITSISWYANTANGYSSNIRLWECINSNYDFVTPTCGIKLYNNGIAVSVTISGGTGSKHYFTLATTTTYINLDPTKYYVITWHGDGNIASGASIYGSSSDLYANGRLYTIFASSTVNTPDTGVNDAYFLLQDGNGSQYRPEQTEFTSVDPYNDKVEADPNINFSAYWFITADDVNSISSFFGNFDGFTRVQVRLEDPLNSTFSCQIYTHDFESEELSTDFTFNFDGSSATCPNADYDRDYKLIWTLLGGNIFNIVKFQYSTTTYFTIGTTTNAGHVSTYVASTTASLIGSQYANGYSLNACNPLSGDFDIVDCILSLFFPDSGYISRKLGQQANMLLTAFPLGYITDFVSILSTSTVGSLTAMEGTIPNGLPGAGTFFSLSLNNGLDTLLTATSSQFKTATEDDERSFYDITSDYWNIVVSVLFVMYLAMRILGNTFNVTYGKKEGLGDIGYIDDGEIKFNSAKSYLRK
jgi:hypothetical protein